MAFRNLLAQHPVSPFHEIRNCDQETSRQVKSEAYYLLVGIECSIAQQLVQEQEVLLRPQLQRHLLAIVAQEADADALDNGPALILQVGQAVPLSAKT